MRCRCATPPLPPACPRHPCLHAHLCRGTLLIEHTYCMLSSPTIYSSPPRSASFLESPILRLPLTRTCLCVVPVPRRFGCVSRRSRRWWWRSRYEVMLGRLRCLDALGEHRLVLDSAMVLSRNLQASVLARVCACVAVLIYGVGMRIQPGVRDRV